jgi:nucleoside-diphosphate-sugar epimerase
VDDHIGGVFRLTRSDEQRPVNVGNPKERTVGEIAELVIELSGSESSIVYKPLLQDDPKRRCPDIGRAREALSWEPSVGGLKKTLEWFAERLDRPQALRPAER